nr:MAG TPA: hypothetical protein [Caudoviricetes sp.]
MALFRHPDNFAFGNLITDPRKPGHRAGFFIALILLPVGAHEAEDQNQHAGARPYGLGSSCAAGWRDKLFAPSADRRIPASWCRYGLAHPQEESVVSPVARTALGKAWTSIAG